MDGAPALKADLAIVGGGLAGGLIALALTARRPELDIVLVEAGPMLGGNHVWSFFEGDIAPADRPIVEPLVSHRWTDHEIRFPGRRRIVPQPYSSIESEQLDHIVRAALPGHAILTGTAATVDHRGITLPDGRRIEAAGVIDARGAGPFPGLDLGWQKFLGQLVRLAKPHGLTRPTIMDAEVDQHDGYRFVYLLPFGPDRVFIEDTYYSSTAALDPGVLRTRVRTYAEKQGWEIVGVEREEMAALPIVMGGDFARLWQEGGQVPKVGMAAGLFHPMTGYSLPDAVRTAALVASLPTLTTAALHDALYRHAKSRWRDGAFYRLLARLLFRAADPGESWRVLARFYGLDEKLIARFYAGRSTTADKLRVLVGKPPVPLIRAIRVLRERTA